MALSASAQFVDGTRGLLCMPSAEFEPEATFMITNNFLNKEYLPAMNYSGDFNGWDYNTFGYAFSVSFWSRLEIAYSCTIMYNKWSPSYDKMSYRGQILRNQDRHFAARVQLTKDGEWGQKWLPAIAIGCSDPVSGAGGDYSKGNVESSGNGYFNRYYIAAAKHFNTSLGQVAGHLAYQYSRRKDGMPTGVCAAVTWEPVWLNREGSFMNNFRATLEWDARKLNFGLNASIWKNHFEFMAMLFGMRYPMVGVRFKTVLAGSN